MSRVKSQCCRQRITRLLLFAAAQENSTLQRLKDERVVLEGSVNYMRARLAVESALSSSEPSSESPPSSAPGPD